MPKAFWLPLWAGLFAAANLHAGNIQFNVIDQGGGLMTFNYTLTGFNFLMNQELDIRFDPNVYASISNGVAGPGFDVLLFDVNNPPGTQGDYTAEAQIDNPPLTGPFSVDFTLNPGQQPGSQFFQVFQLDNNGLVVGQAVSSGNTTAAVPEPASFTLAVLGFAVGSVLLARRRSCKTT